MPRGRLSRAWTRVGVGVVALSVAGLVYFGQSRRPYRFMRGAEHVTSYHLNGHQARPGVLVVRQTTHVYNLNASLNEVVRDADRELGSKPWRKLSMTHDGIDTVVFTNEPSRVAPASRSKKRYCAIAISSCRATRLPGERKTFTGFKAVGTEPEPWVTISVSYLDGSESWLDKGLNLIGANGSPYAPNMSYSRAPITKNIE